MIAAWAYFAPIQQANANCTTPCTKSQITSDINTNWPDNTTGAITPALLRSTVSDLLNSYQDLAGTITNDSAAAGNIAEYISSTIATGASISLTTATPANVTSISLTAGDWDVQGTVAYTTTGTTSITYLAASISTTSATLAVPGATGGNQASWSTAANVVGNVADPELTLSVSPTRISLNATTTVFLVTNQAFTVSTLKGYGFIAARRRR